MREPSTERHPANAAAEAVRALNHLTIGVPSPRTPGWEDLADVYSTLGALRALLERLPQALTQTAAAVEAPGDYRTDDSSDPVELRERVAQDLREASVEIEAIGAHVSDAHSLLSHLASN